MTNAPLKHIQGSTVTTVVDPRFGLSDTPRQPTGWGGATEQPVSSGHVIDVAAAYGMTVTAIQKAIDEANTNATTKNGQPTTVYLAPGDWTLTGVLYMKSYVTLTGAGRGMTTLRKVGGGPCIAAGAPGSIYNPDRPNGTPALYGATIQDLWLDCSGQLHETINNYSAKGIYFVDAARTAIRRVGINDTQASGLGWDYPSDHSIVEDCIVVNPGRAGRGDGVGGNAFGTMSGRLSEEDYVISNCTAVNARAGVVIEVWKEMAHEGHGARIDNCISIDCIYGFENAGVPAATFDSCISIRAKEAGFKFGRGDHSGNDLATGLATVSNCFAVDGAIGVHAYFETPAKARHGSLVIQGSMISGNTGHGIIATIAGYDVDNLTIRGNTIRTNGGRGIALAKTGTGTGVMVDASLSGNDIIDNAGGGIHVDADLTRGLIAGNNIISTTAAGQPSGITVATGRTATGTAFEGGRIEASTPVAIHGTLTDCHVGHVVGWTRAAGEPTLAAPTGTVYQRTDGTAGALLYVSDGADWIAVA